MTEEQATKKKGLGALAWIAIGCGGLIIIAFVVMSAGVWFAGKKIKGMAEDFEENPAKSAAELIVKMNPELELVESDDDEGTITIRVKESGEVATFDYSEIEKGKLSFESSEGSVKFDATAEGEGGVFTVETDEGTTQWGAGVDVTDELDWFPEYPDTTNVQTAFSQQMEGQASGAFSFSTSDSASEVLAFYSKELEDAGFSVQENVSTQGGTIQSAVLMANAEETKRHAQVTITPEGDVTQVSVFYGGEQ